MPGPEFRDGGGQCHPGFARPTRLRCIAGVDPSEVMLRQASQRNRRAIQSRRVELRQGTAAHLPFEAGRFTKAFAVNSFHLWSSQRGDLLEGRRVLQAGGLRLLRLRMALPRKNIFALPGLTEGQVEAAQELVSQPGFRDVRTVKRNVGREVTCLLANK
jgi:ubiquinone/menaquinone biosynthesis C-methylase UbiE